MSSVVPIKFRVLVEGVPALQQGYPIDPSYYLHSSCSLTIPPRTEHYVSFGVAIQIPKLHMARVVSIDSVMRTGLQVIHSDINNHMGEVGCSVFNGSLIPIHIIKGQRIAQLQIKSIPQVVFYEVVEVGKGYWFVGVLSSRIKHEWFRIFHKGG